MAVELNCSWYGTKTCSLVGGCSRLGDKLGYVKYGNLS